MQTGDAESKRTRGNEESGHQIAVGRCGGDDGWRRLETQLNSLFPSHLLRCLVAQWLFAIHGNKWTYQKISQNPVKSSQTQSNPVKSRKTRYQSIKLGSNPGLAGRPRPKATTHKKKTTRRVYGAVFSLESVDRRFFFAFLVEKTFFFIFFVEKKKLFQTEKKN